MQVQVLILRSMCDLTSRCDTLKRQFTFWFHFNARQTEKISEQQDLLKSRKNEMETLNEKISSNRQFGVRVGYPTQTGAVYSTQSGASAVHQTQSGATAGYPKKSRNSTALSTI